MLPPNAESSNVNNSHSSPPAYSQAQMLAALQDA